MNKKGDPHGTDFYLSVQGCRCDHGPRLSALGSGSGAASPAWRRSARGRRILCRISRHRSSSRPLLRAAHPDDLWIYRHEQDAQPDSQRRVPVSAGLFAGSAIGCRRTGREVRGGRLRRDGETNKGFGNYLVVLGMTETVALLVMVFTIVFIGRLAGCDSSRAILKKYIGIIEPLC